MIALNAGVFYFTLGDIPPVNRSSLKAIYLLAEVKSKFINEYGFDSILKPFIADINYLGPGVCCLYCTDMPEWQQPCYIGEVERVYFHCIHFKDVNCNFTCYFKDPFHPEHFSTALES